MKQEKLAPLYSHSEVDNELSEQLEMTEESRHHLHRARSGKNSVKLFKGWTISPICGHMLVKLQQSGGKWT